MNDIKDAILRGKWYELAKIKSPDITQSSNLEMNLHFLKVELFLETAEL